MNVECQTITLSLTGDTLRKLRAFTQARNGSIHNQADAALNTGIERLVSEAPPRFQEAYRALAQEPQDAK